MKTFRASVVALWLGAGALTPAVAVAQSQRRAILRVNEDTGSTLPLSRCRRLVEAGVEGDGVGVSAVIRLGDVRLRGWFVPLCQTAVSPTCLPSKYPLLRLKRWNELGIEGTTISNEAALKKAASDLQEALQLPEPLIHSG